MNLKPWKKVAIPHADVTKGRYKQAEFAADLAQVLSGKAEPEYQDPVEFFNRTYLTEGITALLVAAIERLSGKGGEPVIQLKTAFGGGKTHTMLALYHLLNGKVSSDKLQGVDEILKKCGIDRAPKANIAVIVGTALDSSKGHSSSILKGQEINTLWGEIAAQIGKTEGFKLVAEADKNSVAPGADTLVELFDKFGPCVVLIDELVAYARNIYGISRLPAGSFDSIMTFIQNLTEAVRRSQGSILITSIPESEIEIGGEGGKAVKERLENVYGRIEAIWKPVGVMESFEIVRRRLFTPIIDIVARDSVCRTFSVMYSQGIDDFPSECKEGTYLERLIACYPIHPEIFDRLYEDWATLERFQKTRGVLRFMATVIHELWVHNDGSYLIMPGSIPLYANRVRDELTRYLSEGWNSIVDSDVDGKKSVPHQIDSKNQRFGQLAASRRISRTIFLGTAPSVREQRVRGIEDIRIRLGVVQPGEQVSVFNDALGRLNEQLTHLYSSNRRYWYDVPPNLRRTVEDRAQRMSPDDIEFEILERLRKIRVRGDFRAVHTCPESIDVPDEQTARLVVLPLKSSHKQGRNDTDAIKNAQEILEKRGHSPRQYRNMLVFVAPDTDAVVSLEQETRRYLAWKSVLDDAEALNLDGHQRTLARQSTDRSNDTVDLRLNEAYCWLLVPIQEGTDPLTWETSRISGGTENHVTKASKKLRSSEHLIVRWSPALLKMELDRWLWKDVEQINIKKLWDHLTSYCYLPRLQDEEVLLETIREGLRSRDYFAYANSISDDGHYQGMQWNKAGIPVYLDAVGVLIKPEIAEKLSAEMVQGVTGTSDSGSDLFNGETGVEIEVTPTGTEIEVAIDALNPKRFHATVQLDPDRLGRDAGRIAEEVIQHLTSILGSKVEIYLDIEAHVPKGVPENTIRTVTENCRTLKFKSHAFESE